MDTSWNREKTYYNADGTVKEITTEDGVSIADTSLVAEDSELNNLAINKNVFINKVGQGEYGSYAFVYAADENNNEGWYLSGTAVSL
jgi:hypothetical protein